MLLSRFLRSTLISHAQIVLSSSISKQYFHAGSLSHPRPLENLTRGAAALFALRQDVIEL
jgi:hypothetical protein